METSDFGYYRAWLIRLFKHNIESFLKLSFSFFTRTYVDILSIVPESNHPFILYIKG